MRRFGDFSAIYKMDLATQQRTVPQFLHRTNAIYQYVQGRLHHRKLGANAPKKFQGGRFDVEPGGNVSNSRNFVS